MCFVSLLLLLSVRFDDHHPAQKKLSGSARVTLRAPSSFFLARAKTGCAAIFPTSLPPSKHEEAKKGSEEEHRGRKATNHTNFGGLRSC